MSSNWGIKTDDGYVNFIHGTIGTIDKVWDFETSSSIDDIIIFSERAAKGYAKAIKANAIQISISEQPQLTIPKSIADMADKLINGFLKGYLPEADIPWLLDNITLYLNDEDTNDFLVWEDETENSQALILTYLSSKALGVDLVRVVEG